MSYEGFWKYFYTIECNYRVLNDFDYEALNFCLYDRSSLVKLESVHVCEDIMLV